MLTEWCSAGRRKRGAVEAAVAVDVGRHRELPYERPVGSGGNGTVGPAREVEDAKGVRRRLRQGLVPVHGGDTEQVELGAREREEQGDRVVVPRVAVEDDRGSRCCSAQG